MKTLITILFLQVLLVTTVSAAGIRMITHESTPYASLSKAQIRDFFLKKNKQWPNGSTIRFFDREDESPERKTFLREVVKRSVREVETFWIGQKLYTGHSAPTQVSSDSMMATLVAKFPGSLGYVSENFTGAPGVKLVEITE